MVSTVPGKLPDPPLGGIGSKDHDELVKWVYGTFQQSETNLQNIFREMVYFQSLYLGQVKEKRKDHEKWRANLNIPYASSSIETGVSAELDIMLSSNPWVQAEGVGEEDQDAARAIERTIQHTLVVNQWPVNLRTALSTKRIQGTHVWKISNRPRYSRVFMEAQQSEIDDWQKRVQDASMQTKMIAPDPDAPGDFPGQSLMLFNAWRDVVQKATGLQIPDKPSTGWKNVFTRNAPDIAHQSIFDLRFDPRIYDVQDQPFIMQRSVKTARWVLDRVVDPSKRWGGIFDKGQVDKALSGWATDSLAQWDDAVATMLGMPGWRSQLWNYFNTDDLPVELIEVWRRFDTFPYMVIMNRRAIINTRPDEMPYKHGLYPYVALRNKPQPGSFCGLSDLKQTYSMFTHMNKMYNLHQDALLLSVIPVWLSTRSAGLPSDVSALFAPGKIWNVNMMNALEPLVKQHPHPDMWRLISDLKANIDETQSTTAPVRGGAVTLNRVSATQSERAFSQSLLRQKMEAITTECEMRPLIHQICFLFRDYIPTDDRVNTVGRDLGLDVLRRVPREKLILALDQDFNFRGATQAINRQERMAFFKDFFGSAMQTRMVSPTEARALLAMWWRESGIPGVGSVLTEKGNQQVVRTLEIEKQVAQTEAMNRTHEPAVFPVPDPQGHDSEDARIEPGTAADVAQVGTTQEPF